jgi:hypothetical protein
MTPTIIAALTIFGAGVLSIPAQSVPKFSDYPTRVTKARASSIDFKRDPSARTFRTRLSAALRDGVNFAGHYIVTGWGCGTGCSNAAIIEARTGRVIWPDQFANIDASYGAGYSEKQIDFRPNSRLLIIHGRPGSFDENAGPKPAGDYYYEWRAEGLRLLKFVPVAED